MNNTQKRKTIEILTQWSQGNLVDMVDVGYGICGNLDELPEPDGMYIYPYFESWDEFSGSLSFPVPHPSKDPRTAYIDFYGNMWIDVYGEARMRLCAHIANEMEKELAT